ncbi:MAG: 30S ribosomal protein S17 [Caldilineaceae bacterium]
MRERRKSFVGTVTSDKMENRCGVSHAKVSRHPLYGKIIKTNKKFKAHNENNDVKMGDRADPRMPPHQQRQEIFRRRNP